MAVGSGPSSPKESLATRFRKLKSSSASLKAWWKLLGCRLLGVPSGNDRFAPHFWMTAPLAGLYYSLTIQIPLAQFSKVGIDTDTINEPIRTLFSGFVWQVFMWKINFLAMMLISCLHEGLQVASFCYVTYKNFSGLMWLECGKELNFRFFTKMQLIYAD